MRQPLVIANWKMNMTLSETEEFVRRFAQEDMGSSSVEMVICAPFIALSLLGTLLQQTSLLLGAQNMHWEKEGAFTGEISPLMLREIGVCFVIAGHSERRIQFGETDGQVARKVAAAFAFGLIPILCVGENDEERLTGKTEAVIQRQLLAAVSAMEQEQERHKLIVAYEPVWAIGTGTPAHSGDAAAAAAFIRSLLHEKWGERAVDVRILYGGSVNPENITAYTGRPEIDGALVGNSSLKPASYAAMVRAVAAGRGD
ncbi:MAG TPA: triose-phosphate isomerase [Firmicutes bacterium]|nr:triose-phosphate isomerase [Bacillota bacterium]